MESITPLSEIGTDVKPVETGVKLSLIFPFRERIGLFNHLMSTLWETTDKPSELEMLVAVDDNDPTLEPEDLRWLANEYAKFNLKFFIRAQSDQFVRDYFNPLAKLASGRWLVALNDDAGFVTPHWDTIVNAKMNARAELVGDDIITGFIEDGVLGKITVGGMPEFSSWCMNSKEFVNAMGWFFHPSCWIWGQDQVNGQIFALFSQIMNEERRVNIPEVVIKSNHLEGKRREEGENYERFCRVHNEHNKVLMYPDLMVEAFKLREYVQAKRGNK